MLFTTLLSIAGTVAHAFPGPHAAQVFELGGTRLQQVPRQVPRAPAPPTSTVYGYYPYWGDDPSALPYDCLLYTSPSPRD